MQDVHQHVLADVSAIVSTRVEERVLMHVQEPVEAVITVVMVPVQEQVSDLKLKYE